MKSMMIVVVLGACIGCASGNYIAKQTYTAKDGTEKVRERRMKSYDACQRKARRQAKRRARYRDHNPNYGITTMGGAKRRR